MTRTCVVCKRDVTSGVLDCGVCSGCRKTDAGKKVIADARGEEEASATPFFAMVALLVAVLSLLMGIGVFAMNIGTRGAETLAISSLISGIFSFALFGIFFEISSHLAAIRRVNSKDKFNL